MSEKKDLGDTQGLPEFTSKFMSRRKKSLDPGPGLSLHENFVWSLAGMVVYAACQWGMIVAIAKLGNAIMVGQFSLGLAISTPVVMFTNLQLRPVQATDATQRYSFGEYLGLRLIMTILAMILIVCIVGITKYQHDTVLIILAVACTKGLESLSDIFYGVFQLNDRLDQTGKSMMLRGVLSLAGLTLGLYLTRNVFWGVIWMALVWLLALLAFDARRAQRFVGRAASGAGPRPAQAEFCGHPDGRLGTCRTVSGWRSLRPKWDFSRQMKLALSALPLGIVMMLVSLNLHMPRYFVEANMGESELGIFSALAYTTVAVAMLADALGHSAMPRLSRLYAKGEIGAFGLLVAKLVGAGALLGAAGIALARAGGSRLLSLLFSAKYAAHFDVFMWLVAAAAVSVGAFLLTAGITSAQSFFVQVPLFALVAGTNALMCAWLVPSAGLLGAAKSVLAAALVQFAVSAAVLVYLLSARAKKLATARPEAAYAEWEPGV